MGNCIINLWPLAWPLSVKNSLKLLVGRLQGERPGRPTSSVEVASTSWEGSQNHFSTDRFSWYLLTFVQIVVINSSTLHFSFTLQYCHKHWCICYYSYQYYQYYQYYSCLSANLLACVTQVQIEIIAAASLTLNEHESIIYVAPNADTLWSVRRADDRGSSPVEPQRSTRQCCPFALRSSEVVGCWTSWSILPVKEVKTSPGFSLRPLMISAGCCCFLKPN